MVLFSRFYYLVDFWGTCESTPFFYGIYAYVCFSGF